MNNIINIKLLARFVVCNMAFSALMLGACSRGGGESASVDLVQPVVSGDTVAVPDGSNIASRLELDTIGEEYHSINLTTTGVVAAIPNAYAEVASPMTGRVARVMVRLGQTVEAGSPLYEVSSSEYSEIIKNYLQSKTAMVTARRVKERTQDLYNNKVASERELDEAKMQYDIAMEEYRHAESVCREYQIDLDRAEVGQPLTVRSPIRGRVLDNNLVVGGYLREDSEARVVVGEKAVVKGDIFATFIDFNGTMLGGNFYVKDTLSLKSGCVVEGDLFFQRFQVELDAKFTGRCQVMSEAEFHKVASPMEAMLRKAQPVRPAEKAE